jgi:hypothetical protein
MTTDQGTIIVRSSGSDSAPCSRRDSSMMTAPRDRWLMLDRYLDGDGGPKQFEGIWNAEKSRWEDRYGNFMSRVHSWHPFPENP